MISLVIISLRLVGVQLPLLTSHELHDVTRATNSTASGLDGWAWYEIKALVAPCFFGLALFLLLFPSLFLLLLFLLLLFFLLSLSFSSLALTLSLSASVSLSVQKTEFCTSLQWDN